MTNTFLISEAVLRNYTDINQSVDSALIKNAIRESQDISLQAVIGTLLYDKLLDLVDSGDINTPTYSNYKGLLDNYIQDFLIYAAYWYALDAIYLRSRNNGLIRPTGGENSEGVERELYNLKRQTVSNKLEYYNQRLTNYIIEEEGLFPELTQSNKLYEQIPDYTGKYGAPFVFRKKINAQLFLDRGIPVTNSAYPQYPPPYSSDGKPGNLPK